MCKTSVCVVPAVRNQKDELRRAAEFAEANKLNRFVSQSGLVLKRNCNGFEIFKCETIRQKIAGLAFHLIKIEKRVGKVIVL